MNKQRIYLDTSVFGGCFDEEFAKDSLRLFAEIRAGKFILVLSETVMAELEKAPAHVWQLMWDLPDNVVQTVDLTAEMEKLKDAYLEAKVVGPASSTDAEHIAIATVARADMIISWNFKHIVHYDKIAGYLSVNMRLGYGMIAVYSPKEVVSYDDENI